MMVSSENGGMVLVFCCFYCCRFFIVAGSGFGKPGKTWNQSANSWVA
jgi:hypothetical protein